MSGWLADIGRLFSGAKRRVSTLLAPKITLYKARKGPERKHPVHTKWQKHWEKSHNSSRNQNTSIKRRGHLKASVVLSQGPKEEYQRCLHRNQSCLRLSRWPERKQWVHKNDKNTLENRIIQAATKTPRSSVGMACKHQLSCLGGKKKSNNAVCTEISPK